MISEQLALRIKPHQEATFANFFWSDENQWLKSSLEDTLARQTDRLIYLWGPSGVGKSHLLQACVHALGVQTPGIYLPLSVMAHYGTHVLEGLETQALLCLDDMDSIADQPCFEEALFHCYNRVRDQESTILIMASRYSPRLSHIQLPDLKSRLSGCLALPLAALCDDDKVTTLCLQASKRGLILPKSVAAYVVRHCHRDMHRLQTILNQLDEASWIKQRRLTLPFVKSILDL